MKLAAFALIFCYCSTVARAWDEAELQIFDLVEEINENFYDLLGVQQNATLAEIKRAFRNLSIVLHPDKSSAEDANVKFRNLVSVYETLKDASKREKYNEVLKNGLPNWKSALYYYRRVRKMGLAEMGIILFVILTIGQYLIAWAAYVEKKYTAETLLGSKLKRIQKKSKTNIDMDTLLSSIPSPSIKNTLPFQIPRAIWNTPKAIKSFFDTYAEHKRMQKEILEREAKEQEQLRQLEEELAKEKEMKKEGMRKRKQIFAAKEKTDEELKGYAKVNIDKISKGTVKAVANKSDQLFVGGLWTDEDLLELIRLVKKYPSGSGARWETIADTMNKTVQEVTFMAAKLKENGYRVPGQTESIAEKIVLDATKKVKTRQTDNQILVPETNWTQEQQQLLELAIVKYPKNSSSDRWQKIANSVPEKTKEECLARYRHLVEIVKNQKQQKQQQDAKDVTDDREVVVGEANEIVDGSQLDDVNRNSDGDDKVETVKQVEHKGKPRNIRKERKKRMEFSSDEDENNLSN